ncbi:MAG: hypothetical protein NTY95_18770 [Bacteroidia bacterium]|nr:hypothetical protein [Bacteroidia bacterium]
MKTLIVHPEDPTTTFLSQIYAPIQNKTVVQGGITKSELQTLIEYNDRVLCLGHGSPDGLLNPDQFPDAGFYIVDESMVSALKNKSNCIYIWCYANQFVQRHGLEGLSCAMFLSETRETEYYGFDNIDGDLIDQSNVRFSLFVANKHLTNRIMCKIIVPNSI